MLLLDESHLAGQVTSPSGCRWSISDSDMFAVLRREKLVISLLDIANRYEKVGLREVAPVNWFVPRRPRLEAYVQWS